MSIRPTEYASAGLVGVGTPQANPTVEAEMLALRPTGVGLVTARLVCLDEDPQRRLLSYIDDLEQTMARYDSLKLDAFGFACTGSTYLYGYDKERALVARLEDRFGYRVITAAAAIETRLRKLGAESIALIAPYPDWIFQPGIEYWTGRGFNVRVTGHAQLPSSDLHQIYELGSHQALAVLDNMGNASSYPRGLELRRAIYTGQGNWEGLAGLLPELRKQKLLAVDDLRELERDTYRRLLLEAAGGEGEPDTAELGSVWRKVPSDLKQDVEVLCAYVELLLRAGDHAAAEKLLQRSLKHHWDARLVRLYGLVESTNVPAQLAQAESWLAAHPDEPELLLCLGRLSSRDKLWGKARDYFEGSYRLQRSAEVCAELGRLLTGLGEPKVAAAYFREGLLLSESDLPTLPEPEKLLPLSQRLARS